MLVLAGARLLWSQLKYGEQEHAQEDNPKGSSNSNSNVADPAPPSPVLPAAPACLFGVPESEGSADDNVSIDTEIDVQVVSEDDDDQQLLLVENSVLTTRSVMASPGPPPPPPPPPSPPPTFGSTRSPQSPLIPPLPPPPPPPPPFFRLMSPPGGTADKAVQSTPTPTPTPTPTSVLSSPGRRSHFARTVHTFFSSSSSQPHREDINSSSNSASAVETTALVHVEDPEVLVRSLAVPLALAAPCRSKPPCCTPGPTPGPGPGPGSGVSYQGSDSTSANGRDASNFPGSCAAGAVAAGGDAPCAVAASGTCAELPFSVLANRHDQKTIKDCHPEDNCLECCVYYSVRCCECIVL